MNKKQMFLIVFCLIFLISPVDVIPDPIPFLGTLDDAGLVAYVFHSLLANGKQGTETSAVEITPG